MENIFCVVKSVFRDEIERFHAFFVGSCR